MLVQSWTNTWLWLDQHLRRRSRTNPTRAYCNVLRLWAHNRLRRLKQRQETVYALYEASVTEVASNIRTTSRRDISNLWSLYPASQQTRHIVPMLVQCWFPNFPTISPKFHLNFPDFPIIPTDSPGFPSFLCSFQYNFTSVLCL